MITATKIGTVKRAQLQNLVFSIVIPTWNNLPYLQLCIKSIRQNSAFTHQVIVHINEGKDGTREWLHEQTDIDYTYSDENIGVCYALNSCRTLVTTDYILYINDDMYACPGWDKVLKDEIDAIGHKNFFLSGTAIEPKTKNPCAIEKDYGKNIASFDEARLLKEVDSLHLDDWQGSTWPPNIVHRDTWDLVGGYSIEYTPGLFSDPDFSVKLWKLGVRLFKGLGKCRVYHFGSVSLNRIRKNNGYYTFVAKWAITHNIFSVYYLRKGQKFDGPLTEPNLPANRKLNNVFKQLKGIFARD